MARSARDDQPMRVIIATRRYETSIEDLWDALTNVERITRWFLPVSGDLRLGGRYQFEGNAGGHITRCEPPRVLAVTWELGDSASGVTVTLAEDPKGGTRLELEHVTPAGDHWKQFGAGAAGVGWDLALLGLARHIANGGGAVDHRTATKARASVASPGARRQQASAGAGRVHQKGLARKRARGSRDLGQSSRSLVNPIARVCGGFIRLLSILRMPTIA